MLNFFGAVTIGLVFRHFISGTVFIASFYISSGNVNELTKNFDGNKIVLATISIIVGSLLYSIHRAIMNPLFDRLRHRLLGFDRWKERIFPKEHRNFMLQRWEYTRAIKSEANHIYDWGDYVALLYTSFLAVITGSFSAAKFSSSASHYSFDWKLISIACIFLISGFVTDCRKHIIEEELYSKEQRFNWNIDEMK